jgi:hypothetical protein
VAHVIPLLAFGTKMSEERKPSSPGAMQVKNWRKTIIVEEKLGVISKLAEGEHIFDICCMLGVLILAYVQFVIMLIELQTVLSQELKCLCSKTTTSLSESMVTKTMDVSLLHFYCIRI